MSSPLSTLDASSFCSRPIVRRAYSVVVVGLAAFLLTLVVLREPFRGYLAEVRVVGPSAEGIDLLAARAWLREIDRQVVVVSTAPTAERPHAEIRMTYQAPVSSSATARLDDLAGRLLYQYLPGQLSGYRRQKLQGVRQASTAAHAHEDQARAKLDLLRQEQLAEVLQQPLPVLPPAEVLPPAAPATLAIDPEPLLAHLTALRMELARLLGRCTEEHPEVIRVRSQIAQLEAQLSAAADRPAAHPVSLQDHPEANRAQRVLLASGSRSEPVGASGAAWRERIDAAYRELAAASQARQAAEHRLSDVVQELASLPGAADWKAQPAIVVTRIGGTPRSATLGLASLLAVAAAAVMLRASAAIGARTIETRPALAAALELPVLASPSRPRGTAQRLRRLLTPSRVLLLVRGAEAVVVAAAAACLLAVSIEPSLAGQVLSDPFGTLSEVIGRFFGN